MEPIKVDFNNKRKKEIVIPPEKAVLKTIISILLTICTAGVAFYVMMPAINPKAYDFYMYIGIVAASFVVWQFLLNQVFAKPEYTPYIKKQAIVPGIIIGLLVVAVAVGWLVSSEFFRAKSYSSIISVNTDSDFASQIDKQDTDSFKVIPQLDEDTATQVAPRCLGTLEEKGYVSQFTVYPSSTQINYKGKPARVYPLQYASLIKWLFNTSEGFPGYVVVDMASKDSEFIFLENVEGSMGNIRYSPSEHFNKLLKRHLRFAYPTFMFGDATLEIDEKGIPYWICPRIDNTIGLFGGTDVIGAVVVRADDPEGTCTYYTVEDFKTNKDLQWVDRVYSANLIVQQYNFFGKYRNGFWNSVLGQKNVVKTTTGYSYLAKGDDVWMYTGVTSVTSDQSITGFAMVNQRTKEAVFYSVQGGTESSAQVAAQARVKDLGYTATFPLLLNIGGEPTYFLSLKDETSGNGTVQQYAFINVKNCNTSEKGSNAQSLAAALQDYADKNGLKIDDIDTGVIEEGEDNAEEKPENNGTEAPAVKPEGAIAGKVDEIREAVKGGESYYYIKLEGSDVYYSISASQDENVVILNKGDSVEITANGGSGKIIAASAITIK